ncbi:unnamed protein product [Paramecium pentaurelia]|uniref:Uncharacterized protein n=1 Tax=Paramecium pentaurelia TaxID=43138 RepID=A0A8S1TPZ9_9CILI|nr:unnamed protein product [Paramecium pentaurelia]
MNNDLCESIVNHANQIYISLANLNGQLNENGSMTNQNPTSSNTSPTLGLAFIMFTLFAAYALLSIFSPQRQPVMQKGNIQPQQNNLHDDD